MVWVRKKHGPEILKHGNNIKWTTDGKLEIISKVLAGNTNLKICLSTLTFQNRLISIVKNLDKSSNDKEIKAKILEIRKENPNYSYRRITTM